LTGKRTKEWLSGKLNDLTFTQGRIRWRLEFMRRIIFVAVVCAVVAVPTLADLGTIQVDYQNVSPSMTIPIKDVHNGIDEQANVLTGVYNLKVRASTLGDIPGYTGALENASLTGTGQSIQSFCIDTQDSSSTSWQTYTVKTLDQTPDPAAGPMGDQRARLIAKLLDDNWAWGETLTNVKAAALQLAVWEIVAETPGSYDLDRYQGNFYVNSTSSSYAAVKTLAESMLGALGTTGNDYLGRYLGLSSHFDETHYQDFVVRVPVPGAVLLGLLGLSAAGIRLRRFA
jgi:hypothetical protein